jgi:ABC-type multidrug transport system ATPase subunit
MSRSRYAVYNAAQTFILEKETKVREALRMQGVGNITLVASWFASLGLVYFVMALGMSIASKVSLFENADFILLLLGYWLCLVSFMAFSFTLHTLFNKAKTGGLFNVVIFAGAFALWESVKTASTSTFVRFLANLHPGTACCFMIYNLGVFEGAGAGVKWSNLFTPLKGSSFGGSVAMLIFDTVLYTVLGWWLEMVLPKEFGTRLSLCFCCSKSYWRPSQTAEAVSEPIAPVEPVSGDAYEEIGAADKLSLEEGKGISLRALRKEFQTPDGTITAVNDLTMAMAEGQIFALLGHNGAGKTTTINMLNGLYAPTSGTAFIYGKSVRTQMSDIRKDIGNCFQHDVLYPDLTVDEHISMYAKLKGIPESEVKDAVTGIISQVGLTEKVNTPSKALSGGMKRKLSLSTALIGGPKVLYLDEPTSGMDPYSRRSTWNMLQSSREGRTMILTTHFMEEADLLGDRIGIMGGGKLLCCGSSMFLKRVYGSGYVLVLETSSSCDEAGITSLVSRHVPAFTVQSSVGKEKTFQLPMDATSSFAALFGALETNKATLGVVNYGMSITTMESVFLKIIQSDNQTRGNASGDPQKATPSGSMDLDKNAHVAQNDHHVQARDVACCKHIFAMYMKRLHYGKRDKTSLICSTVIPIILLTLGLAFLDNSFKSETSPPLKLDYETSFGSSWVETVPIVTTGAPSQLRNALANVKGAVPAATAHSRNGTVFGIGYVAGCPASVSADYDPTFVDSYDPEAAIKDTLTWGAGCTGHQVDGGGPWNLHSNGLDTWAGASKPLAGPTLALSQTTLVEGAAAASTDSVLFGAMAAVPGSPDVSILVNTSATHVAPIFLNALSNGFGVPASQKITVRNAPLPTTSGVSNLLDQFSNIIAVLFIVIAFSFIPGSVVVFVVKERESHHNSKHQQLVSGVSLPAYWIASWLWDATLYCVPLTLTMIIIAAFDFKAFTGDICEDWNSTQGFNPMALDFFKEADADFKDVNRTCNDVLALYDADQGLLTHWGECSAVDPSDVSAVSSCASVPMIGDNYLWNDGACKMAGLAPTQWAACMQDIPCHAQVMAAMAPGQTLSSQISTPLSSFPPAAPTAQLDAAIRAMWAATVAKADSKCKYSPTYYPKPLCELHNERAKTVDRPPALIPCDVMLSDVCPISTDSCPVSRTAATFLLFWGFGLAIISFSYVFSYLFAAHTTAQIYSIIITFILGLVLMLVSMILDTADFGDPNIPKTNRTLKWFYRLFSPGFCLGNGLLDMAFSSFGVSLGGDQGSRILVGPSNPVGWDNSGRDIFFLFLSTPLVLGVAILIDFIQSEPKFAGILGRDPVMNDPPAEEDEDVVAETQRVQSGDADGDVIRLHKLRKVYKGGGCCSSSRPKVAIRDLSFGIARGECFGFLGINGAGKTSTMNILTGNFLASSGNAWLNGLDIQNNQRAVRSQLGYCPQHDALLDLLTVKEHLFLFGRIKGVSERQLPQFVDSVINEMDLGDFANKLAGRLSGGNKRKLSVGIATIGRPPLLFLDEPSTGMDPVARRFMWDVITRITSQDGDAHCSVILTTHSMEECEALCDRVGIMVGGRLRCLGTAQHLKSRFGQGYQLELKLAAPTPDPSAVAGLEPLLTAQTVGAACMSLGDPSICALITSAHPAGCEIHRRLQPAGGSAGTIPALDFVAWFRGEQRAQATTAWVQSNFPSSRLVERHDRKLRFKLGGTAGGTPSILLPPSATTAADATAADATPASGGEVQLAELFSLVEAHQGELGLDDYAISQTTLEQIFNGFASAQEEETHAVRGVVASAQNEPSTQLADSAAVAQAADDAPTTAGAKVHVSVPEGATPGQVLQVSVQGVTLAVTVPEAGAIPGSVLEVEMPDQAAIAAAAAVAAAGPAPAPALP